MFESEIKTALKNAGLSEDLWTKITVKTVDEIAGAVAQLKADTNKSKSYTTEELVNILKEAGLDEAFQKALQSETDRRVMQAIKTHDEKLKKDAEEKAAKEKQKEGQETMTPEQKEIQSLKDTIKVLGEKIEGVTTKVSTSDKDARIKAALKNAGLAETFAANIIVDDPEKIDETVKNFKAAMDAQLQTGIDQKLAAGELASVKKGASGQTVEQTAIADYAKTIGKGGLPKNPDFPGKISSPDVATEAAKT